MVGGGTRADSCGTVVHLYCIYNNRGRGVGLTMQESRWRRGDGGYPNTLAELRQRISASEHRCQWLMLHDTDHCSLITILAKQFNVSPDPSSRARQR